MHPGGSRDFETYFQARILHFLQIWGILLLGSPYFWGMEWGSGAGKGWVLASVQSPLGQIVTNLEEFSWGLKQIEVSGKKYTFPRQNVFPFILQPM